MNRQPAKKTRAKNPAPGRYGDHPSISVVKSGKLFFIMGTGFANVRNGAPFYVNQYGKAVSINNRPPLFADKKDADKIMEEFSDEFLKQKNPVKKRAKNPVPESRTSKLRKATKLYEDFRDKPGNELLELDMPDFSTGMVIGRLTAAEYDTVRGNNREDYRHKFNKKSSPLLCVTACGRYLFTVLGNFEFTERGIVDKG